MKKWRIISQVYYLGRGPISTDHTELTTGDEVNEEGVRKIITSVKSQHQEIIVRSVVQGQ